MVSIAQQQSSVAHYSNDREEDGVTCSYDSMSSLIEDIKLNCKGLFDALIMVNEVNYLNGYKLIGKYEIENIKSHFRNIQIENIKKEILEKRSTNNEILNIEKPDIKSSKTLKGVSQMRQLQKGYMKLLSI